MSRRPLPPPNAFSPQLHEALKATGLRYEAVKMSYGEEYIQQCLQEAEQQQALCELLQQHPLTTAGVDNMAAEVDPRAVTANSVKRLFAYGAHMQALTAEALCSDFKERIWRSEDLVKHSDQLAAGLRNQVASLEHQHSRDHTILEQQAAQISNLQNQLNQAGAADQHLLYSNSSGRCGQRPPGGNIAELEQLREELAASHLNAQRLQQEVVSLQGQLHRAKADLKKGQSTERRLRADRDQLRAAGKEKDKKISRLEQSASSSRKRHRGETEQRDEIDGRSGAGKHGSGGDDITAKYLRTLHHAEHWHNLAQTLASQVVTVGDMLDPLTRLLRAHRTQRQLLENKPHPKHAEEVKQWLAELEEEACVAAAAVNTLHRSIRHLEEAQKTAEQVDTQSSLAARLDH
jgi:hypothetical protein